MIREDELREFRKIQPYTDGTEITLDGLKSNISTVAQKYSLPLAFKFDQIKSGGILSREANDALVLYHPEHEHDYCKIAISIRRQGTMAFVSANDFGTSKNMKKLTLQSNAKSSVKEGWKAWMTPNSGRGGDLTNGLIGGAVGALRGLGGSKAKLHEEENYYEALKHILDEVIC